MSSIKHVTFNPRVTGVEIMSLDDYTAREMSACWYNAEENDQITTRCYKIITRMQINNGEGAEKYCTRGLEGHTKIGSVRKRKNRALSIAAVLAEQSNQWIDDRVDEQAIADAYTKTTSSCQLWAQEVGKRDQEAAEEIVRKEQKERAAAVTRNSAVSGSLSPKSKRFIQTRHAPRIPRQPSGARAA